MRQCRTAFAKRDTPLLLLFLEVWRGFSVQRIMNEQRLFATLLAGDWGAARIIETPG